jgi:hypothetical protein
MAGEQLLTKLNAVRAVRLRSARVKTPKIEFKDAVDPYSGHCFRNLRFHDG